MREAFALLLLFQQKILVYFTWLYFWNFNESLTNKVLNNQTQIFSLCWFFVWKPPSKSSISHPWWMDDLQICPTVLFNSISVISGQWKADNERLCAMEPCLKFERFPLPVGLEPRTATSWTQDSYISTLALYLLSHKGSRADLHICDNFGKINSHLITE